MRFRRRGFIPLVLGSIVIAISHKKHLKSLSGVMYPKKRLLFAENNRHTDAISLRQHGLCIRLIPVSIGLKLGAVRVAVAMLMVAGS
jgi:hypothetical protein